MKYMKIDFITLENFRRISSGINKKKITIDFTNLENSINLVVGPNGSGKTSIMRCLHPFAFNSSIGDSSSNSDLICEGCDGKKTIQISYGDDIYFIEHFYTRKKDALTVKSFIKKNDIELNENGTSNSFKSVIYDELGINETFLSILSIGNRVEGFVDYAGADRKNLITKTFVELDIFNKYYKKMVGLMKEKKAILGNIKYKLSKYGNTDIVELQQELCSIENNIRSLNSSKNELLTYIGGVKTQLDGLSETKSEITKYETRLSQILDELSQNRTKLTENLSKEDLTSKITELDKSINDANTEKSVLENKLVFMLDKLNSLTKDLESAKSNLDKLGTGENISDLKDTLSNVDTELASLNVNDIGDIPLSKDDLIRIKIYLDQLKGICNKLLINYDIKDVESFIESQYNSNCTNNLRESYNKSVASIDQYTLMTTLETTQESIRKSVRNTCKTTDSCPYYSFYQSYMDVVNNSIEEIKNKISRERKIVHDIQTKLNISSIIDECYSFINENSDILSKIPKSIFNKDTFLNKYTSEREVYDNDVLTDMISLCESVDRRNYLNEYRKTLVDKISFIEKNAEVYNSLSNTVENNSIAISTLNTEISCMRNDIDNIINKLHELNSSYDICKHDLDILDTIETLNKEIADINDKVKSKKDDIAKITKLENLLEEYTVKKDSIIEKLVILEKRRDVLVRSVSELEQLKAEEVEISEEYDIISDIQLAVSPTKGIPVEFIENIFKRTIIDKMNQLLDTVYHGKFKLLGGDNITINDKEFKIPYIKNGNIVVDDICHASDGERAMITLAFSLVLIQLSLDKYTIMLLDEIDTSLDQHSRGKFIDLLEKFMSVVNCHQLFLISHNNMFDNYPVNVIVTSENGIDLSHLSNSSNIINL